MYIVLDRDLLKTTKAINAIKSINSIKIMKTIKAMKAIKAIKANILLEQRQYKNDSTEFRCMLILNLPPCFPHRIAE